MRECEYHRHWNYTNHGGHLPCGECDSCKADRASLERLRRYIPCPHGHYFDTAAGPLPELCPSCGARFPPAL